ncbi:MAG TPA: lysylphosphatidylglycerol synthase transmembrane domain-containing protein [Nannocystaceae bacterium]|nr:lysylphosphatidylglycerol synthase transmembrane domain-containing protein [Nannocystaceae bacterium]
MSATGKRSTRTTALLWLVSLLASALFLWLAREHFAIELWPDELSMPQPMLFVCACALHPVYATLRAMRLQYALDPLAQGGRFDRRVLYGSGFVSFLVLLLMPLKLGEASRPILLAQGRQEGVGLAESVGAVALERVIDGVLICAMLFGGLAAAQPNHALVHEYLGSVQRFGQLMTLAFTGALVVALVAARSPARARAIAAKLGGLFGEAASRFCGRAAGRVAEAFAALLGAQRWVALVLVSLVYWAITVLQLWLVAHACGVPISAAGATAMVAIVGLSIQLPGGPAQAGTYQVGSGAALTLLLGALEGGLATAAAAFVASMFALQLLGAAAMALPGAVLLALAARAGAPPDAGKPADGP